MKKVTLFILFFVFSLSAEYRSNSNTQSGYNGPKSSNLRNIRTVENIKRYGNSLDRNDTIVVLKGYVTRSLGDEKYEFTDKTGSIRAEIDDDLLRTISFNDKILVKLTTEVDTSFVEPIELDVKRIEIVK